MDTIYVISGLGADERVFQRLKMPGFNPVFIRWETPKPTETIEEYAGRLRQQIPEENPIIAGLSFGGMMAIEIAKQIKTKKIILIATVKTKNEIPWYIRLAGRLRLHKCVPIRFFKSCNWITYWFFSVRDKKDKSILKQIFFDADPAFLVWAVDQVVKWKNTTLPENYVHIHGTKDKILPIKNVKQDHSVEAAGHLLTLTHHQEIDILIRKLSPN
ncbi:MAG: alpha/beta hydrolase [Cryomorphaceae bacterium]|nr:alpha/beta hydrolase [Cryomorphaceae bacterium]